MQYHFNNGRSSSSILCVCDGNSAWGSGAGSIQRLSCGVEHTLLVSSCGRGSLSGAPNVEEYLTTACGCIIRPQGSPERSDKGTQTSSGESWANCPRTAMRFLELLTDTHLLLSLRVTRIAEMEAGNGDDHCRVGCGCAENPAHQQGLWQRLHSIKQGSQKLKWASDSQVLSMPETREQTTWALQV